MQTHELAKNHSTVGIIKFAIPTILTMIFTSTYIIVDGIFISQFVNEDALAAINIVFPIINLAMAFGMMMAFGANAIIGKLLGEGKPEKARSFFTAVYIICALWGAVCIIVLNIFMDQIIDLLGASEALHEYCRIYLGIYSIFLPFNMLQIFTQAFFITAGKPLLSFTVCFIGGISNMILDYVFIVPMDMGLTGAALATGIGAAIPAIYGVIYFLVQRKCILHFCRPNFNIKFVGKSLYNGSSEAVNNISAAITLFMFNVILMELAGESGVAAITVILYVQMLQTAIYFGYSFGVSSMISYKFGEKNYLQLKKIILTSFKFIVTVSIFVIIMSTVFAEQLVSIFIDRDSSTFKLAVDGLRLYSIAYLFMGMNVYMSAMFTALSNGKISAILSFARSFVFLVIALIILPILFGVPGVFVAVPVAEFLSLLLSIYVFVKNRSLYNY